MSDRAPAGAVEAIAVPAHRSSRRLRRQVAPSAGLALLLAGGALAIRVAVMTAAGYGGQYEWLYTSAALVLAGVALVLVALPKLVPGAGDPEPPSGHAPRRRG